MPQTIRIRLIQQTLVLLVASISAQAVAETVWVDDKLYVPMRTGPSAQHKISHRGLVSGTALEVLTFDAEAGFYHVMLSDGRDGFIPAQYISKIPIAEVLLEEAQATIEALNKSRSPEQKQLSDLSAKNRELSQKLSIAESERNSYKRRLDDIEKISKSHLATSQRNKSLMAENEANKNTIDVLQAEKARLVESTEQEWFINGAGAVVLGVIIALVVPRLVPKKRGGEWA